MSLPTVDLLLVLVAVALSLAGCNLLNKTPPTPTREVETNTPESAALRYTVGAAANADAAAVSFSAIHTWALGRDSLVAYSFAGGYEAEWSRCNGQARVTLEAGGWQVAEAGARCWQDEAAAITGVYAFITDDNGQAHTVIYGDVLSPDVTAVSIEFAVRGESAVAEMDNAAYWLMRPGQQPPLRAFAIDEIGYLVGTLEFDQPLAVAPVGAP